MNQTIDPAERLLNLVIALVNTSARMTKEEIRSSVAGYDGAAHDDAFERMFERDKVTLRDLGVPIVTVDTFGHADDIGYRIDMEAYALDAVDLTPAEFAVVGLAAEFWQDRALARDTSRALTKLRAGAGQSLDSDAGILLAPRVRAAGDAFGPIFDAILARRIVTFTYRTARTGETKTRTVAPYRIAARGGGWYLIGLDHDREDLRVFRLSRIVGRVRATGPTEAFEVPEDVDVDDLLGSGHAERQSAVLALRPERADALRARGTLIRDEEAPAGADGCDDRDFLALDYTNHRQLVREITGYGEAVVVISPPELRADVIDLLRAAASIAAIADSDSKNTDGSGDLDGTTITEDDDASHN